MKTRLFTLLFVILVATPSSIFACTCEPNYFCEYVNLDTDVIAFKGVVVDYKFYTQQNEAVYIKRLKTYRNDFGMTEIVKLYSNNITSCGVSVDFHFPVGDTVFVAIIGNSSIANNPDAGEENFYEHVLIACNTNILKQKDGLITGAIERNFVNFGQAGISQETLEKSFENCSIGNCIDDQLILFPNPTNQKAMVLPSSSFQKFSTGYIIASDGRVVKKLSGFTTEIDLTGLTDGVYFIQFECDGENIVKKLVLNRN